MSGMFSLVGEELLDISELPLHRRHLLKQRRGGEAPVGLARLEAEEELSVAVGEPLRKLHDEALAGAVEIVIGEGEAGHPVELGGERRFLVQQVGTDQLVHGARVTHQCDQKALDDVIGKAIVLVELRDVEQVARMLPELQKRHNEKDANYAKLLKPLRTPCTPSAPRF